MVPLCLLACWLAWWGMTSWLSPKPAWSITLPEQRMFYPVQESLDQRMLLCFDVQVETKNRPESLLGMVLLDTNSGYVLHRLSSRDFDAFEVIGSQERPHLHQNYVGWFKRRYHAGETSYRFHRWHFREGRVSTPQHSWKGNDLHSSYPSQGSIVLFRYTLPQSVYYLGFHSLAGSRSILAMLNRLGHLPQLTWYESWELPTEHTTEPRFLARWPAPYHGWGTGHPHITEDGKWAIFGEPNGIDMLAAYRAKQTGKFHFTGEELFNLFRSHNRELLVFNTMTGRVQHRFKDQAAAYHHVLQSQGNYLVVNCFYPNPDSCASMIELQKAGLRPNDDEYQNLFLRADQLFRIDESGITKLRRSPVVKQAQLGDRLFYSGKRLQVYQPFSNVFAELEVEGDEMNVKQVWTLPKAKDSYRAGDLLSQGNQVNIVGEQHPLPDILSQWFVNTPMLKKWAGNVWHFLHPEKMFSIAELTASGSIREHVFAKERDVGALDASQLYTLLVVHPSEDNCTATLNAYALPMKLHSPWWSRVAGLLPLLLLLAYCLRANHPRRLAGG